MRQTQAELMNLVSSLHQQLAGLVCALGVDLGEPSTERADAPS